MMLMMNREWEDESDVRDTGDVVGEGDKAEGQNYNAPKIVPGQPVNGASALKIVRSQISSMSANKEKEKAEPENKEPAN